MNRIKSIKILAFVVTGYMLVALIWWAILLQKQNSQLNSVYTQHAHLAELADYNYQSTKQMIMGEALVFGLALVVGMWLIYRSYASEVKTEQNKSNFLLSVTHELRSPLTGISLNLETLKKMTSLPPLADQSLSYAQQETERLKVIVENLLSSKANLNNLSNPRVVLHEVNLQSIVQQVITNHYPHALVSMSTEGNPVNILAENESIITIYRNLLDNALKYSPENANIIVKINYSTDSVQLSVKDQAPHIPTKDYKAIFNAFHRIEDERVRTSKGIGLGLYLAQNAAKKIGGKINVAHYESGNIFTLSIPQ